MKTLSLLAAAAVTLTFFATPSFAAEGKAGANATIQKQEDRHATERTESYEMSAEENAKADTQVYHNARMSVQERREQEQKLARRHINEQDAKVEVKTKARNTFND